jgi:catechol 2,3-dioxygenase-like lactoylglutathione lyase family enzyme
MMTVRMGLEVVVIPVSDVERAKCFYRDLGWRLDADIVKDTAFRLIQFTPPGSGCSIHFGRGITSAPPGSAGALYLVVADISAAHQDLVGRGVEVSEIFHRGPGEPYSSGPDPQHRSYGSFVSFNDPDGNAWVVQEVTVRLPGHQDEVPLPS